MAKKRETSANGWQMAVFGDARASLETCFSVRTISELKTPPRRLIDDIYFDGLDILRCSEGHFRFSFRDRPAVDMLEGETLVIYPRHVVTIEALAANNALVYGVFEGRDVAAYFDAMGFFDCAKGKTASHYDSIRKLRELLESPHENSEEFHRQWLLLLSDILKSQAMEMRKADDTLVFDAVRQIHHNIRHRISSMKVLCDQMGVSRVHLHRLFVKAGLGSPSDFIRNKQLHYVRDLLEHTELPVAKIAEQAGFLSSSHFASFVRRMTNLTPSQVRKGRLVEAGGVCHNRQHSTDTDQHRVLR